MTSTIKTHVSDDNVEDFIALIPDEIKKQDSLTLLKLFTNITGEQHRLWSNRIIDFGQYHYKSEKSKQEGDWMLTGFSPRKQNLTLYIMHGLDVYTEIPGKLGKYKTGMGCLYVNRLTDVNMAVLEKLIKTSYSHMKKQNNV